MEWLQRIIFLLSLVSLIKADDTIHCQSPPPTSPGIRKPSMPSQFSVHVEMIDVIKSSVTSITEYYDAPGKRAALFIAENAGRSKRFYRYDQQLFLEVSEDIGMCISVPIAEGDHLMGFKLKNGTRKILSPSAALDFNVPGQIETYVGKKVIRGINTDHWYSCVNMEDPKVNLAINWYFSSADTWNTAGQSVQVPVRSYVKGVQYDASGKSQKVEQYSEYYHYRTGLPKDETVFDTPRGLICKKGQHPKDPPMIPKIMSFRLEHIDTKLQIITYSDEVYDFDSRITKHVYQSPTFFNYGDSPLTVINDFNTGVSYNIDMKLGNCSIRPISQLPTDVEKVDSRHVRMTNPKEFFQLKNHFYQGERITRDIDCDVWIGDKTDKSNNKLTTEWFFAKTNIVGLEGITGHTLVHYAEYRENELLPAFLSNLYDFTEDEHDVLQFDVSECYTYTNRENFEVFFDKKYMIHISSSLEEFKFNFIMSVANTVAVSPLRIQNVDVNHLYDGGLSFTFELLDAAPKMGDVESPIQEKSLAAASRELHQKLKDKNLEVFVRSFDKMITINPVEMTFDLKRPKGTTYSGGSMFALGFVMTLIGMVLAAIFVYKVKP